MQKADSDCPVGTVAPAPPQPRGRGGGWRISLPCQPKGQEKRERKQMEDDRPPGCCSPGSGTPDLVISQGGKAQSREGVGEDLQKERGDGQDNPGRGSFWSASARQSLALSHRRSSCPRSHRAREEHLESLEKTPPDKSLKLLHPRRRAETWGLQHPPGSSSIPGEQHCPLPLLQPAGSRGWERKADRLKLE